MGVFGYRTQDWNPGSERTRFVRIAIALITALALLGPLTAFTAPARAAERLPWEELTTPGGASIAAVTLFILPAFHPEIPPGISYSTFALSVSLSLTIQIAVSTLTGALLPIGARAIKLDPAVVAAPAITTLVDIFGMVIYFSAARAILGL